MAANLSAVEARARDAGFVDQCSLWGLQERLPLRWPTPPNVPPSPKRRYRSHYVYPSPGSGPAPGWEDLLDPAAWAHLSDYDLVLRLVDFSGLRPVLAQRWAGPRLGAGVPLTLCRCFCSTAGRSSTDGAEPRR